MAYPQLNSPIEGLQFLEWAQPRLLEADRDAERILHGRDEVLARFGPIFRDDAEEITEEQFGDFLDFEQNKHWTGLHRQKRSILSDISAVRRAVKRLVQRKEFDDDLEERFNFANKAVKGFGEAVITPVLFVAYPDDYAVWNSKSDFALKTLCLEAPVDKGDTKGRVYVKINGTIRQALNFLNRQVSPHSEPVDLWTIDYYWHAIKVMNDDGRLADLIAEFRRR
jgi:hypothetical protein